MSHFLELPDDYEVCSRCSGTGTITEFRNGNIQRVRCSAPNCIGGRVRRKRKRSSDGPATPVTTPIAPEFHEAVRKANEAKEKLQALIARTIDACQPLQLPGTFSPWSAHNPEIEEKYRRDREQLHRLSAWVFSLDPTEPDAETRIREVRERWQANADIHIGLWSLESCCSLVRLAQVRK